MARINYAAIAEAETIWDDPGKEIKIRAFYDGFVDSFLPTWIRFPTLMVSEKIDLHPVLGITAEEFVAGARDQVMASFGPQDFSC